MIFLLKKFRLETGMSQRELAKRSGLTQSYISHLENHLELPSFPALENIAASLDMCPYSLINLCVHCNMVTTCERKKYT